MISTPADLLREIAKVMSVIIQRDSQMHVQHEIKTVGCQKETSRDLPVMVVQKNLKAFCEVYERAD
jgi:hypothetical protein